MSNYTCSQLQEDAFANVPFSEVPNNCCRPVHVQPFTLDLHLFGFECNEDTGFFIAILLLTFLIKILQNFLGTWVGQLERELMQLKPNERKCLKGPYGVCGTLNTPFPKCCGKLGYLIWLEIVGGVIGILSILVITGNNFWIWFMIIFANSTGVFFAVWRANPDHHSPAAEFMNLVKNAESYNNENSEEGKRAHEAILKLKEVLERIEPKVLVNQDFDDVPGLRKRLIL